MSTFDWSSVRFQEGDGNLPTCDVGECERVAPRVLAISSGGEVRERRPLCEDPICEKLARQSAADFTVHIE